MVVLTENALNFILHEAFNELSLPGLEGILLALLMGNIERSLLFWKWLMCRSHFDEL